MINCSCISNVACVIPVLETFYFNDILQVAELKQRLISGATTGGNGGSRLRAPLERGRRVQTAIFFYFV